MKTILALLLLAGAAFGQCGAGGRLIYNPVTKGMDCTGLVGAGTGTVTSVGASFTGGLISLSGTPVTGSGTLGFTVAMTSGGIVYGDSASSWASSGAMAAGQFMLGGGAGAAPTTSFSVVPGVNGGTGVANTSKTITLGGNLVTSGAFNTTLTVTAGTSVTLPTTGTLVNSAVATLSSLTSIGTIATGVWQGTAVGMAYGGTGADFSTIAKGGMLSGSGAGALALTTVGSDGQVWTADTASTGGAKWSTISGVGTVTSVVIAGTANQITASGTCTITTSGTCTLSIPNSPQFTTPVLGLATVTSINGLAITSSTGTLTIANGVTLTGPSSSATVATIGLTNTFTGRQDASGAASTSPIKTGTSIPGTCIVGDLFFKSDATAGQNLYQCAVINTFTQQLNSGAGGATTALDNLASVAINTALLPAGTGIDGGSTAKPFRDFFLFGTGTTYGTNYLKLTGAPTGTRTVTFPDASITVARSDAAQTFTGTQTFGALVATTVNGNTFTTGTGVLTIAAGKTLTVSNTLTLAGTDSTVMTFPTTSATIARTDAANTFTGTQTIGALVVTTVNGNTFTTGTGVLTIAASKTLTASNSITLAGTDSTTMTFPSTSQTIPGMNQTNTAGSSLVWDLAAASVTAGLKIPSAAGAVPTADGFIATNTTNHTHVWGSNGTTMVGAIAATGTGTATTCTNQFVSAVSSLAIPTCTTVSLAGAQFANQGTATTVLHGNGAGNPSFGAVVNADITNATIDLTTKVTGLLPLANGGTAANLTANNGGIFYSTASAGAILAGTATAGQIIRSGASTTPAWSTATYPATTTINRLLYSSSANVIADLATANGGILNAGATGVPALTVTPVLGVAGTSTGTIGLSGVTSGVVTIQPASAAGTWSLTLPTSGGTNTYVLQTNGSGVTSWAPAGVGTVTVVSSGNLTSTALVTGGGSQTLQTAAVTATMDSSGNISTPGSISSGSAGTTAGSASFYELAANGSNFRKLLVPDTLTADLTMEYPNTVPSAGDVLTFGGVSADKTVMAFTSSSGTGNFCRVTSCTMVTPSLGTPSAIVLTSGTGLPLSTGVTGTLPLANGGTAAALTASNGGLFYSTASAGAILSGTATARQMLQSGSSTTPAWSTTTWPATTTVNRILWSSSANVIADLATSNGGLLNASASGVPSLTVTPVLGVAGTSTGTIGLSGVTSGVVTIQPASVAGTWSFTLPTTGGTNGYVLQTNGSGVTSWVQAGLPCTTTALSLQFNSAGAFGCVADFTFASNTITSGASGILNVSAGKIVLPAASAGSGIAITTTSGNSVISFDSTVLAGVYATLAGTQTFGISNSFTPSTTAGSVVLVPSADPSAPAQGTLNVNLAGWLNWVSNATGPVLKYPVAAGSAQDLTTLSTGMLKVTTTTGALSSIVPAAGTVMAGATPAFTATPTLGVAGATVGDLTLANATSGGVTLRPVTGALGSTVISLPAFTSTMVAAATSTTTTQALFATATAGAPAYRAVAAGDLPATLTSGTAITSAALTTAVITTDLHCATAGGCTLATNALPASSAFIGASATNNIQLTGTATSAKVATFPDFTGTVAVAATSTTATFPLMATATAGAPAYRAFVLADVSNFGSNVATFLATPSGANFNSMIASGGIPVNCNGTCAKSAAYTTVLGDGGGVIIHSSADNNARTFTIDSNANVAYPLYTVLTFVNAINTVTISITSDTMTLAGTASTGSRTLAVNGVATAVKIGTTSWLISGPGLT